MRAPGRRSSAFSWPCSPRDAEARPVQRLCVFCGSSTGNDLRYREAAQHLGRLLASRHMGLVFGGGSIGLMGVVADATLAAGGEVIGVIPHALAARELAHREVADMRIVPSMHARKALVEALLRHRPPEGPEWITPDEA
jgi:uncharacterized protein (TIGR00730 family)